MFRHHTAALRDNIEGNRLIEKPDYIRGVIDSPEFQRLRNIRQMGLASYVFPTAEHSRFAHSLGAFGTAQEVFWHLNARAAHHDLIMPGLRFDDTTEKDFCIAAMCHDLGHTAFSHVLETTLLPENCKNHEACTILILSSETEIATEIQNSADKEAVIALIEKNHPNPTLNDLVSGAFDVDRCDYVLRDSVMSGVEYGQFDLKWLIRALNVELNPSGRPMMVLDGPRGLDALRQFFSARRYMHRQVYYHRSVRSVQLLMKSIFERMQDLGPNNDTRSMAPRSLHCLMKGEKPTLGEFLSTTDAEVMNMIRNFARAHKDKVLKHLSNLFVRRQIPKCILDSSRLTEPISTLYRIADDPREGGAPEQQEMWPLMLEGASTVLAELRDFVARQLAQADAPAEAARYLVNFDAPDFRSFKTLDFLFAFGQRILPYDKISPDCIGFNMSSLLEEFTINRLFVPRGIEGEARDFLDQRYRF